MKKTRVGEALICLIVFVFAFDCAAQKKNSSKKDRLPRVGTIRDYPATGLMTGCGNVYSHFAHQAGLQNPGLVFISRGEGDNAWMNLDGRDARLRQVKLRKRKSITSRPHYYRFGKTFITVLFEDYKPKNESAAESDWLFQLKIILRRGRAVKTVRAVGYADC